MIFHTFNKNKNGRFNPEILKNVIHAVDRYNNPCEITDGKVTRKYTRDGQTPSFAPYNSVGGYQVGINKDPIRVYAFADCDPHQMYPTGYYRELGKIDENGKLVIAGFPRANEILADGFSSRIAIDGNGNILGHEGAVFDEEGHRIFVNEHNNVDILQTKLYLLFDYIVQQIERYYEEYIDQIIAPECEEYYLPHNYYVKGKNGLPIEYLDFEAFRPNYSLNIGSINNKNGVCFQLIYYPNGKVGGWIVLNNKIVPISEIKYSNEIELILEKILNEVDELTIDEERLFACGDNRDFFDSMDINKITQGKNH